MHTRTHIISHACTINTHAYTHTHVVHPFSPFLRCRLPQGAEQRFVAKLSERRSCTGRWDTDVFLTHSLACLPTHLFIYPTTNPLSSTIHPTHSLTQTHLLFLSHHPLESFVSAATCRRMIWDIVSNSVRGRRPCWSTREVGVNFRAREIVVLRT